MKLEDIQALWAIDCNIEQLELDSEALKISKLHEKYWKIYINEKIQLYQYQSESKILKMEKFEFFTQGHTKETVEKGWELPAKGAIIKSEVPMYMEGDRDIINLNLKIIIQEEKVNFIDSIIKSLRERGFNIKNAIEFIRFQNGGF